MSATSKNLICVASAVALALLFCAAPAHASEARHEALGDNPLAECEVDVVDYPGMLPVYGNGVYLTLLPPSPVATETNDVIVRLPAGDSCRRPGWPADLPAGNMTDLGNQGNPK